MIVYILILSLLFGIGYSNDTLIQIVKLASAKNNIYKLSYYFSKLTLVNRFSIAFYMPLLGYFIDTQNTFEIYKILLLSLNFGMLVILFFYSIFGIPILKFFNIPFLKPSLVVKDKQLIIPFIGNFLLIMGALFPIVIAGLFNEYRATSLQSGIVFNFIGTLIFTFIIDKKIVLISEGSEDSLINNYSNTLYTAKVLAVILCIIISTPIFFLF